MFYFLGNQTEKENSLILISDAYIYIYIYIDFLLAVLLLLKDPRYCYIDNAII